MKQIIREALNNNNFGIDAATLEATHQEIQNIKITNEDLNVMILKIKKIRQAHTLQKAKKANKAIHKQ